MTASLAGQDLELAACRALLARLRAAASVLLPGESPAGSGVAEDDAGDLLERLVEAVAADRTDDRVWLLLTAIGAAYPTAGEVEVLRRRIEFDSTLAVTLHLLDDALSRIRQVGTPMAEIELVVGGVLADVDHSAKHNLHTGIQRVTRNLLPQWGTEHPEMIPVAWAVNNGALRRLGGLETRRIFEWSRLGANGTAVDPATDTPPARLVVPWRSVVVLVEVPAVAVADRVAALGQCSGNKVVAIGYDAIPVVSADTVPPAEAAKFTKYLTAVKATTRVAGISAAATAELAGFTHMLPTQGLTGPIVGEVSLPSPANAPTPPEVIRPESPVVLVVGSHEPRKNHLAVLHAAEQLWRSGLEFSLEFIGGSGWGTDFPDRVEALTDAGRPVLVRKGVSDEELEKAYAQAMFTMFPSLHEGYGLPVAESLAHGTPVITSNFGSTAEIAAGGGAVLIDPRDDRQLTDAMRSLLTDPGRLAGLRAEIANRNETTWAQYAGELWKFLVAPELAHLAETGRDEQFSGAHRASS